MRKCARAIIFDEQNRLLVFERERRNSPFHKTHHYYSIPGGGVETGEVPEEAVIRELHEEMLVGIAVDRFLVHQIDEPDGRENFYYLAHITSGTPIFNPHSEEALGRRFLRKNIYKVAWVKLDDPLLAYHEAYGQLARELVLWLKQGNFPSEPVDMFVKNR